MTLSFVGWFSLSGALPLRTLGGAVHGSQFLSQASTASLQRNTVLPLFPAAAWQQTRQSSFFNKCKYVRNPLSSNSGALQFIIFCPNIPTLIILLIKNTRFFFPTAITCSMFCGGQVSDNPVLCFIVCVGVCVCANSDRRRVVERCVGRVRCRGQEGQRKEIQTQTEERSKPRTDDWRR